MVIHHFGIHTYLLQLVTERERSEHICVSARIHEIIHTERIAFLHIHTRYITVQVEFFVFRFQQSQANNQAVFTSYIGVCRFQFYYTHTFTGFDSDIIGAIYKIEMIAAYGCRFLIDDFYSIVAVIVCGIGSRYGYFKHLVVFQYRHGIDRVGEHYVVSAVVHHVFRLATYSQQCR